MGIGVAIPAAASAAPAPANDGIVCMFGNVTVNDATLAQMGVPTARQTPTLRALERLVARLGPRFGATCSSEVIVT